VRAAHEGTARTGVRELDGVLNALARATRRLAWLPDGRPRLRSSRLPIRAGPARVISINTNAAATQAVQALAAASGEVQAAQQRVATGLKVKSAKDDAATYAIAQNMRTRSDGLGTVIGGLNRARSLLDVTYAAAADISDALSQMKQHALTLSDPTLDAASQSAVLADLQALTSRIDQSAQSAAFNGTNLLVPIADAPAAQAVPGGGPSPTLSFSTPMDGRPALIDLSYSFYNTSPASPNAPQMTVAGTNSDASVSFSVPRKAGKTANYDSTFLYGDWHDLDAVNPASVDVGFTTSPFPAPSPSDFGVTVNSLTVTSFRTHENILCAPDGATEQIDYNPMTSDWLGLTGLTSMNPDQILNAVATATLRVTKGAQNLGSTSQRIASQIAQLSKSRDTLDAGIGNIVDADMAQEAARLQAAQARRQLATTSLSMAAASSQWISRLFQ
jgi:flagellin